MDRLPRLLCVLLVLQLTTASDCPQHPSRVDTRKPLYLLTLVPLPSGVDLLAGALTAQDEVNSDTNLLSGYRVELVVDDIEECSSTVGGRGLTSLVKHLLTPSCCPVVAVMGLECSSHTAILSPVAGRDGFNIIQLSAANSPIFMTESDRFPHLWHLLGSATAYTSTVLAIMDQYSLNRTGLVYSLNSDYYRQNAYYLRSSLTDAGKNVTFSVGILGTQPYYCRTVFSEIHLHQTSIIVSLLDAHETAIMLSMALEQGLTYPNYLWIHLNMLPEQVTELLVNDTMQRAAHGHMFLHTLTHLDPDKTLVSGETYRTYSQKLQKNLKKVKNCYSIRDIITRPLTNHIYDQVWAIALALNNSLPVLDSINQTIENYAVNQSDVTAVIEEQLANVSFQGAGGWVEFNQYNSVSTPVEVYWVTHNGTWYRVGLYDPVNISGFKVTISSSDIPGDTPPPVIVLISFQLAVSLYCLAGVLFVFTTIILILYLSYRHHKVIKATSPNLSLLMFAGCYTINFAVIVKITFGSFEMSDTVFLTSAILHALLLLNGTGLIFITLFVKLVRLYHIFSSLMKKDLGKFWEDFSLFLLVIFSMLIPNIAIAVMLTVSPPKPICYDVTFVKNNITMVEKHIKIESTSQYLLIGIITVYIAILLCLVLYIGVNNRKIKHKALNDTRRVLLFLTFMAIAVCLVGSLYLTYLISMNEPVANIILVCGFMVFVVACLLILFLPKIVQAVMNNNAPFAKQTSFSNRLAVGVVSTIITLKIINN